MAALSEQMVRAPTQRRSREAARKIYAATNRLLAEKAFDQIAVSEIARRAGVAVGSIYQRFASKEALLWAMYERYLDEAAPRVVALEERIADCGLEERVRAVIDTVIALFRTHRGIVRSLLLKYRQDASQAPAIFHQRIALVNATMKRILRGGARDATARQIEDALELLMAGCRERILFSPPASPRADAAYARFLTAAIMGAMRSEP